MKQHRLFWETTVTWLWLSSLTHLPSDDVVVDVNALYSNTDTQVTI